MSKIHEAKPSYLGDQSQFEFPTTPKEKEERSEARGIDLIVSPQSIERVGSIFIKSGIPRVTPFPKSEDDKVLEEEEGEEGEKEEEGTAHSRNESENSHYSGSPEDVLKHSLMSKRPSLRPVNSISSNFINPYFRRSLLRKHKDEVINDEVLGKRVQSLIHPELETPVVADGEEDDTYSQHTSDDKTGVNTEDLEIPRRSSKRISQILSVRENRRNSGAVTRMGTIRSGRSGIDKSEESLLRRSLSIHTLATDLKKSMKGKSFKSVDFATLDKLLEELLEVQSSDSSNISRKSTMVSGSGSEDNKSLIRPFQGYRKSSEISRQASLKRSFTKLNREMSVIKAKRELPELPELVDGDGNGDVCELKRSNAISHRNRFVTTLVEFFTALKRVTKRCFQGIKRGGKKAVLFPFLRRKKSRNGGGVRGKTIGNPVVVDIHQTAFKTHNLNSEVVSRKTFPVGTSSGSGTGSGTGSGSGSGPSFGTGIKSTPRPLSTIESEDSTGSLMDTPTKNPGAFEKDELIQIWKHYLSESINQRIDLKMDMANIGYLDRVASIQSGHGKRRSVREREREEIEKLMSKYVAEDESLSGDGYSFTRSFRSSRSYRSYRSSSSGSGSTISSGWLTVQSERDDHEVSTIDEEGEDDDDDYTVTSSSGSSTSSRSGSSRSSRSSMSSLEERRIPASGALTNLNSVLKSAPRKVYSSAASFRTGDGEDDDGDDDKQEDDCSLSPSMTPSVFSFQPSVRV